MTRPAVERPGARLTSRAALLAASYTSAAIQRERSAGRIVSLRRGLYTKAQPYSELTALDQHGLRARAAAATAPSLVVSHLSAAVLHELPIHRAPLEQIHLTRPGRGGNTADTRRSLHTGRLTDAEIVDVRGTSATSLARTVVDLARTSGFATAVIAADAALHREPAIAEEIGDILGRARYLRGAGRARRALLVADGRSESVGESRLRIFNRQAALPAVDLQCRVFDESGVFVGRSDFGYVKVGVLMEFDGKIKYGKLLGPGQSPLDVLDLEKRREDNIRELGWQIVRVIWSDLADPAVLESRIRATLRRGARAAALNGIAGTVQPLPPIQIPR